MGEIFSSRLKEEAVEEGNSYLVPLLVDGFY